MGCDTSVMRLQRTVWTKRSTVSIFVPFHRGDALRDRGAKVDFRIYEVEGPTQVRPAIRYSNDGGKTWSDTTAMMTAWTSGTSWVHMVGFHAISNDYMAFEIGLEVQNASGTAQGTARAELVITTQTVFDLEIGRDVQAWSSALDAIAGISPSNNTFIVGNGTTWVSKVDSAARDALSLGTSHQPQFTRVGLGVAANASYSLTTNGPLNVGVSGSAALYVSGAEALWYNGTYFSWGFGGTWNRFADKVRIGDTTTPSEALEVQGNARIEGLIGWVETATSPIGTAGVGKAWVRNDSPNTLMFTDDSGDDYVVAGVDASAYIWVVRTADSTASASVVDAWDIDYGGTFDEKTAGHNINFDENLGKFVVSNAGAYHVAMELLLGSSSGSAAQVQVKLQKNGSDFMIREVDVSSGLGEHPFAMTAVMVLTAGEYLNVKVDSQTAATVTVHDDSSICIHKIGGPG